MINRYFAVGLITCLAAVGLQAQQSLSQLVSDAKADWMFGQWEGQSDNGDAVKLNVSWDLDKHVAVLHVKTSDMESKGFSAVDPDSGDVTYQSFDTRGAVGKGKWGMEGDELVLRIESRASDRGPWKAAFVFTGSPSEGLQVRMHSVNDSGDLVTPARATFKFKKQKPAAAQAK